MKKLSVLLCTRCVLTDVHLCTRICFYGCIHVPTYAHMHTHFVNRIRMYLCAIVCVTVCVHAPLYIYTYVAIRIHA